MIQPAAEPIRPIEDEMNERVKEEDIASIAPDNHLRRVGVVWAMAVPPVHGYSSIGQGAYGYQTNSALSQAYSGPNAYASARSSTSSG